MVIGSKMNLIVINTMTIMMNTKMMITKMMIMKMMILKMKLQKILVIQAKKIVPNSIFQMLKRNNLQQMPQDLV